MTNNTSDQSGQIVHGNQINIAGNAHIEEATFNIDADLLRRLLDVGEQEDLSSVELETEYWEPETLFVPAGPFLMGSGPAAGIPDSETPNFKLALPDFRIGKYPVTNEQFARFIRQTDQISNPVLLWDGNQPAFEQLDQPVCGVTWYEALEYCRWLSEATGRLYCLPSEAQWERAARGTDGRVYPWGNEWDPSRCNVEEKLITAVSAFPAQNELGCHDLAGNTREWTRSAWGKDRNKPDRQYQYPREDDCRNGMDEPETSRRIFRGGWASDANGFRCSARGSYLPQKWGPKYKRHGFRVVLLPIK